VPIAGAFGSTEGAGRSVEHMALDPDEAKLVYMSIKWTPTPFATEPCRPLKRSHFD
jgi:hypothetical protein